MSVAKKPKLDNFEIMYPVLPDDLIENTPRTKVYVDTIIDPKNTSKIVIELNSKLPIPELCHLKRINTKTKEILLCPVNFAPINEVNSFLKQKQFDTTYLQNNIRIVDVAKIAPITRNQYEDVQQLWPCNFHSNKYLEKLCTNTLFNNDELIKHRIFMKICIDVAESSKACSNKIVGAIVVDPKIDSVVAIGFDKRMNNPCQHAVMVAIDNVARTQNGGAWDINDQEPIDVVLKDTQSPSNNSIEEERSLSSEGNPFMDSKFLKDVELISNSTVLKNEPAQNKYKNEQKVCEPSDGFNLQGIPIDMRTFLQRKYNSIKFGASRFESKSSDGPYLCTNYNFYMTHEPCIMCSMALVHSRVKRVFYGAITSRGGLGSACKIHTVKNLNHHYEVFAGLLEDECSLL